MLSMDDADDSGVDGVDGHVCTMTCSSNVWSSDPTDDPGVGGVNVSSIGVGCQAGQVVALVAVVIPAGRGIS